ncbi:hypothetical protein [Protaetiibacter intestinalis]|uniref:Uncharacterized protein n=1 Tax=Protaetiibacter intestinalis TaxID=2419774 RepID=A0A387BHI2_9MICO|nr:hypothetical protein [Protaetiibacter intestinalis]AYF98000.1 hypothetical protein D7I47_06850 [Protaetiibacter intestinalis]
MSGGRRRPRGAALALALAGAAALAGCATAGSEGATAPSAPDAAGAPAQDPAAERAAMECVTGAWVAEAPALQAYFDAALEAAGASEYEIIADGSIVYEFIEHGFGMNVLPTAFTMRMPTNFGDVLGEITGQASGVWTVSGEEIRVVADGWESLLETSWSFKGQAIEADPGTQSLSSGFTDIDHFVCAGDELVLQSPDAPPLTLSRMVERD